jgi:AcrR family transcriptional regulator
MALAAVQTETTILDAARDEVLEHGIRRTSASDIARRAGISRQTLYRYWPDAQAVFTALITRELVACLPRADDESDGLDGLTAVIVDTADRLRTLPILQRLRDTDPELFARYILERLGATQRAVLHLLEERVRAGQVRGFVREGDPAALAAFLMLIVQSAVQSDILALPPLTPAQWHAELTQAVRGYLRPERS